MHAKRQHDLRGPYYQQTGRHLEKNSILPAAVDC